MRHASSQFQSRVAASDSCCLAYVMFGHSLNHTYYNWNETLHLLYWSVLLPDLLVLPCLVRYFIHIASSPHGDQNEEADTSDAAAITTQILYWWSRAIVKKKSVVGHHCGMHGRLSRIRRGDGRCLHNNPYSCSPHVWPLAACCTRYIDGLCSCHCDWWSHRLHVVIIIIFKHKCLSEWFHW